jgi:hypothetical protein
MAFKMRSGNTPKFKKIGSSPLKVTNYADALDGDLTQQNTYLKLREKNLEKQLEALKGSKEENTTRNERILRGEGSKKDRAEQAVQWEQKQAYLNEMAWNSKNYTGDYTADRWSGTKIKDLRFSFKDAIMGGDLTSGFSTKKGGGSNNVKKNKKNNRKNLTNCPVFKKDKNGNAKGSACIAPQ